MVAHLLWILAIYGIAVALVHILHARRHRGGSPNRRSRMHYELITSNHERQVEWYLRALSLYALLSGTRVRVTVLDDRSDDDTMVIVHRLANLSGIELHVSELNSDEDENKGIKKITSESDEHFIRIDLRIPSEAVRIPYVQG
ncbi:hypothetical protein MNQ98_27310 [Paenibacillus sp. N3/727]|uniref:hypothetical protein n=1 Tax=Paenibacillus sp. N3/727 TaxID=2925845 RepID=UPI001F537FA7|nr:hypothetical protein [Paenibacillus sp. N3/727]UNK18079.1 hypothetical protein MNQ98_27310 [Paenibacillus sp. N3/727]